MKRATITESNSPPRVGDPRLGYVATYGLQGVAGVRVRVQTEASADFGECVALPRSVGLTDVEFLRVVRAARDGGLEEVAGIVSLTKLGTAPVQLETDGRRFTTKDCFAVARSIVELVPASSTLETNMRVVYLDPVSLEATYVGRYDELVLERSR